MSTALKEIVDGEKSAKDIPEAKKNGLFNQAVEGLRKLGAKTEKLEEKVETVTASLVVATEIQAANAVGNFAEGYLGRDRLQIGPVDGRTVVGTAMGLKGLYDIARGKTGGAHWLAVGNGLMAAGVGSSAREAGVALKERWAKKEDKKEEVVAQNQPALPAPQPAPQPAVEGELERMIEGLSRQVAARAIHHRDDPEPRRPRPHPAPGRPHPQPGRQQPGRHAPANRVPVQVR